MNNLKVDTARILVSWECNLKCPYCCNEQARFRKDIAPISIEKIRWNDYRNFCISGGEPLLHKDKVWDVCRRIPAGSTVILYTNGILVNRETVVEMEQAGIQYFNIGLHYESSFDRLIKSVTAAVQGSGIKARFHAQDIHAENLQQKFPGTSFRFWKMDDCDRENEHRFVLDN